LPVPLPIWLIWWPAPLVPGTRRRASTTSTVGVTTSARARGDAARSSAIVDIPAASFQVAADT
jgi:hypothetical protein